MLFIRKESVPGTSKKFSCGFLLRHHAKPSAGTAKIRAAPAATPPAIAPVLDDPPLPTHESPGSNHTSMHVNIDFLCFSKMFKVYTTNGCMLNIMCRKKPSKYPQLAEYLPDY